MTCTDDLRIPVEQLLAGNFVEVLSHLAAEGFFPAPDGDCGEEQWVAAWMDSVQAQQAITVAWSRMISSP